MKWLTRSGLCSTTNKTTTGVRIMTSSRIPTVPGIPRNRLIADIDFLIRCNPTFRRPRPGEALSLTLIFTNFRLFHFRFGRNVFSCQDSLGLMMWTGGARVQGPCSAVSLSHMKGHWTRSWAFQARLTSRWAGIICHSIFLTALGSSLPLLPLLPLLLLLLLSD